MLDYSHLLPIHCASLATLSLFTPPPPPFTFSSSFSSSSSLSLSLSLSVSLRFLYFTPYILLNTFPSFSVGRALNSWLGCPGFNSSSFSSLCLLLSSDITTHSRLFTPPPPFYFLFLFLLLLLLLLSLFLSLPLSLPLSLSLSLSLSFSLCLSLSPFSLFHSLYIIEYFPFLLFFI